MHGLNKSFKENPMVFMRTHPLDIHFQNRQLNGAINDRNNFPDLLAQGHYDFDISGPHLGAYHLNQFEHRGTAGTWKSNRIHAYWLPWDSDREANMILGRDADFFFTSALAGCRIQIGAGETPRVMHISGQLSQLQRQALANQLMPGSRRFSSTQDYSGPQLAFLVGKATTGTFTRTRRWRFYAQGIGVDPNTRNLQVVALRAVAPGIAVVEV